MMWLKESLPEMMKMFPIGLWVVSFNIFSLSPYFGHFTCQIKQLAII